MIGRLLGRSDLPPPLAELTAVVVARLQPDGTLVTGNRGLRLVLDLDTETPLPASLEQAHLSPSPSELAELAAEHRGAAADPVFQGRLHLGPADGPVHTLEATIYADDGELLLVAEHLVEESARMTDKVLHLNQELAEIQRSQARELQMRKAAEARLEARSQALTRSNEELDRFASIVSHDLKEPLRMVSSYLELLERRAGDVLDEEAREFLTYAVDGAHRMDDLLDALNEYARVDRSPPEPEPVALGDVVADARANLAVAIEDAGVEVLQGELPTIRGDRRQLVQLFQNLLSNAIKHGIREGDGSWIRVRSQPRDGGYLVTVTDDGPGIPEEARERIFEIFQQGPEAGDGTGLGLALCQRIVEAHGGTIWVEDEAGAGASFHMRFPQPAEGEATGQGATGASPAEA